MKRIPLVSGIAFLAAVATASDHNNLEKGRPLSFDDAYSIAYRSVEFQSGVSFETYRKQSPIYGLKTEVQFGIAKNKDISIGFEPSFMTSSGKAGGNAVELSYFEGLSRETSRAAAMGYRLEMALPVSGGKGLDLHARGIITKTLNHYDKVHLNLDITHATQPTSDEKRTTVGLILGYSSPIGYPKLFDRTFLAEIGIAQSREAGSGWYGWVGVGLRKQVSATGVMDVGISSDFFRAANQERSPFRFTLGFSRSY